MTSAEDRRDLFEREGLVHLPELLRVCTRLVGDRTLAEDLVQETFLQGWRSFPRYRAGSNCRAWLYRILFLVLADYRRRTARAPSLTSLNDADEDGSRDQAACSTPATVTVAEVRDAFDRLPDAFRLVVMLADVEEHSYREIAEALGIPIGTVMSRLSRARRMLRRELSTGRDDKVRLFRRS